jgi:tRNA-2-methylthio-N6-dimethylallyladenosine synthase
VAAEVGELASVGVREVTLIGQNVNSYQGGCSFASLLRRVASVPGIERVRFTTSHPHDLSDELIQAFRDEPRVMPHFHLPVQSGSDAVLRRMRRDYGVEEYLDRHRRLSEARPGIAITTDFIVGFPGETDEDFEASLRLLRTARFDNSFSFVFSPRPHTGAALHLGSAPEWQEVPRQVCVERLERLQAEQRSIAVAVLAAQLGREVELLVEGVSDDGGHMGRTPENRVVHLDSHGRDLPPGSLVRARVVRAGHSSLGAELAA